MTEKKFTHFDEEGNAQMVNISDKEDTERTATASGLVAVKPETLELIEKGEVDKGDVLGTARIAGIMAAKKTSDLIPMCHPLNITGCDLNFQVNKDNSQIKITASVKTYGKTGVEMEALTAVSAAALTIYDMCKSFDKDMIIKEIFLVEKTGGRSGTYVRT